MLAKIDWDMVTQGYNDNFRTPETKLTVKAMLEELYKKTRSMWRMEPILGVNQMTIRAEMIRQGIPMQPRGHLRPTKLDRFKQLTDQELKNLTNKEIADKIGCRSSASIQHYKYLKKCGYDYRGRNLQKKRGVAKEEEL